MADFPAVRIEQSMDQLRSRAGDRLPAMTDDELMQLATKAHVKIARMMNRTMVRLKSAQLFGDNRSKLEPHHDSVAIQIIFEMADRYERMRDAPLGIQETEADREKSLMMALLAIQKAQNDLFANAHRINEHSTKLLMDRQKLAQQIRAHEDDMEIARERLAKATMSAKAGMTDAELRGIAEAKDG